MKNIASLFLILILIFSSFSIQAVTHAKDSIYYFNSLKHYGEEEGLLSKTIYSSIQDKEGFIWFATDAGVFRYDGRNFKRYTLINGLSDNEVLGLFEDHIGRIWFLTFNGRLSFWEKGKINNSANTDFLKEAQTKEAVFSCFEDSNNRLWFGTQSLGFLLISNNTVTKIKVQGEGKKLLSEYLYEDNSGEIWSFRGNKMFKLLEKNFSDTISLPDSLKFHCATHGTLNNEMFFFSSNGVFKIFNKSISLYIPKKELPSSHDVLKIVSKGEYLWICTLNGCYEYRNGKFTNKYLQDKVITSMLCDRENNLWFNTMGESAFMIPANDDNVKNINQSTGLSGEKILSLARSNNGSLWIGYNNGMVDEIYNGRKKTYNLLKESKRTFLRVTSLIANPDITWCGTDLGVHYVKNGMLKFIPAEKNRNAFPYYTVKSLLSDLSSNIWITSSFSFLRIISNVNEYYLHQDIDSLVRSFSIIEIKKNNFVISCSNGLMEYIPNKVFEPYKTSFKLNGIRIIDMKLDEDSLLILASDGYGVFIFKNRILLQTISSTTGLSDDNCNKIFISKHEIYIATNNGVSICEKKNNKYSITKIFTTDNGLLSNIVNDICADDTAIYIATDMGLTILKKSFLPPNPFIGSISINELITNQNIVVNKKHYSFYANTSRLVVKFSYNVYNPSNKTKVKYRLVNYYNKNSDWTITENNQVEFSSLRPGYYIFQLKPNIPFVKDDYISNLYITILPFWWQTTFAKSVLIFILCGLIIIFAKKITKIKFERQMIELRQQTALELERNRIASDMHDDIGADLTYIAILGEIVKQDSKKLELNTITHIDKISESSKKVIDKIGEIIWALNSSNDSLPNLISYLHKYLKDFLNSKNILCFVNLPPEIPDKKITAAFRRNIFLIFKEAANNIIKHSRTEKAEITFHIEGNRLRIIIQDFGTAVETAFLNNPGNGLRNMQKRAAENNAVVEVMFKQGIGTFVHYYSKI